MNRSALTRRFFLLALLFLLPLRLTAQSSDSAAPPSVVLIISSTPPGAIVSVDDLPDEVSPYRFRTAAGSVPMVRVTKAGYAPLRCTVGPLFGDTVRFTAMLERRSAPLAVVAGNPLARITVDGVPAGTGRVDSLPADLGEHAVTVFDPDLGRSVEATVMVEHYKRYLLTAEFGVVSVPRLGFGMLLPGSAQMSDGAAVKGLCFAAAGIGSAAALAVTAVRYDEARRGFSSALDEYDRAKSEAAAMEARRIADRREEEYHTARDRFRIVAGTAALVWIANAADLFVHHLRTDRLRIEAGSSVFASLPAAAVSTKVTLP